jgi:diguanylate cyclase (GGDEF)-like protein
VVWLPLQAGGSVVGVLEMHHEPAGSHLAPTTESEQVDAIRQLLALTAAAAVESTRSHATASRQARLDALTGLGNRRQFDVDLAAEWRRAGRYDRPLSVAIIDVDHFKSVNDTAGHATGDTWLRTISQVLGHTLRGSDTAYRVGGEEFVVLLPESDVDAAAVVAERLRRAVEEATGPESYPSVTISVGVASVTAPELHEDTAGLLAIADRALYDAKNAGRNRVVLAAPMGPH